MSGRPLDPIRSQLGVDRLASLPSTCYSELHGALSDLIAAPSWPLGLKDKPPSDLRILLAPLAISYDVVSAVSRSLLVSKQVAVRITDSELGSTALLNLALGMEQFIDEGLVVLIPEEFKPVQPGYFLEWGVAGVTTFFPHKRSGKERDEGFDMALALDCCQEYPNALDLACPTAGHHKRLLDVIEFSRAWADRADHVQSGRLECAGVPSQNIMRSHDRINYLPAFLSLPLPIFDLNSADLMSLHHHGLFEHWKAALEEALRQAYLLDEDTLLDPDSARVRMIRDMMTDAEQSTRRSIKRSRVLRSAELRSAKFTIAAASGALGTFDGPTGGAGAAGAAFLLSSLIDWLGGRPSQGQRAFRRMIPQIFGEEDVPLRG